MRILSSFALCFFFSFSAAADRFKVRLSPHELQRAKSFVKHLPIFSPLQNNGFILDNLISHRELSLAFESDSRYEDAEDHPDAGDVAYVVHRLDDLDFLTKLTLTNFDLKRVPDEVLGLKDLVKLDLSGNMIEEIPSDIAGLRNLVELDFSDNFLSEVPESLGDLNKLMRLRLSANALTFLSPSFGKLVQIRRLDLSDNAFRRMPDALLKFKKMTRLDMCSNLISYVPTSFLGLNKLKKLNLKENPLVGVGWAREGKLGARGLRANFQKRVWISEERFIGVADFNAISRRQAIEDSPWHIEKLAEAQLFESTKNDLKREDVLAKVMALFRAITFDDDKEKTYLDHTLLYEPDELQSFITVDVGEGDEGIRIERFVPREMTNAEIMISCVLPKIKGFTQQLFEEGEKTHRNKGWQPKTKDLPVFRDAFAQTLCLIEGLEDPAARTTAFMMLLKGMLHCPTAQKSAYETIIGQLTQGQEIQADTLPVLISKALARMKEAVFARAMLQENNAQNSHLLQYYKEKLGNILGLSNATIGFVDESGTIGFDRFYKRAGNAFAYFFTLFEPDWVAQELCEEKHKLTPREVGSYFIENKLVDYEGDENWWQDYFTEDPTQSLEAKPKPAAMSLALKHLGYVKGEMSS